MGQEYMRAYWAIRQLAAMLVRAGFPVLRFDYYGTGDSAGDSGDISLERWQADIHTAIDELKSRTTMGRVSLVGLRLGARLAAVTSAQREDVRDLVLWDPVVIGKEYLAELDRMHRQMLIDTLRAPTARMRLGNGGIQEQLGFPLPPPMRQAIEELNLVDTLPAKAERSWLIVSEERPEYRSLQASLARSGIRFEYQTVPDASEWNNLDKIEKALLPSRVMQAIATALKQETA
jgi:pimeloyl-ACP methyl ester carboxylesterase